MQELALKSYVLGGITKSKSIYSVVLFFVYFNDFFSNLTFNTMNMQAKNFQQALDCLLPMGITSENVAERYGGTRLEFLCASEFF